MKYFYIKPFQLFPKNKKIHSKGISNHSKGVSNHSKGISSDFFTKLQNTSELRLCGEKNLFRLLNYKEEKSPKPQDLPDGSQVPNSKFKEGRL